MRKDYQKDFERIKKKNMEKPRYVKNGIYAFCTGGIICCIGQMINNYFSSIGLSELEASNMTSLCLVFAGAFLTGIGVYDKIGKHAGCGSIVPITGFANSVVSPAMEFKKEGYIFGAAAKMFVIAGPVIVFGVISSVFVGLIYYFFLL